jgi:hypothetical protein
MSLSNYAENAILDHVFGPTPMAAPAGRFVSLHTDDEAETGAAEMTGTGYARQAATFGAAVAGVTSTAGAVVFTNSGVIDWTEATHFGIWDAASGGNFLGGGELTTAKTVGPGDTATFAIGELTVVAT